ncbi:MAG: hypothetical protein S4CHLAM102_06240 [Chlamydiia bacterium]|nr:hypothetical protein [Chlamydiia bacterium]
MKKSGLLILFMVAVSLTFSNEKIYLGVDEFFTGGHEKLIKGKRVGILTNHTGVNRDLKPTLDLFRERAGHYKVVAIFTPEHGLNGKEYAGDAIDYDAKGSQIPIYSLHGKTRRPTKEMLKEVDVIIFDIQDIGCRSYTYSSTLFYAMEEAAKHKVEVIVLDRPNPQTGLVVDGPMLSPKWRSFLGYVNVPYCHGMTIGEYAKFFNEEYQVGCKLHVIPMRGWKRHMTYYETGLSWVPTSPHIPEADTPFFYSSTGILGELDLVNIGVGYTLPFKVVGAPWIDGEKLASVLNEQKLPGVRFVPHHYRPFYGSLRGIDCQGVLIHITDPKVYRPLSVQYLIIGVLKSLYPEIIQEKIKQVHASKQKLFCQANGNSEMLDMLMNEKYISWKMIEYERGEREKFLKLREGYLLPSYE